MARTPEGKVKKRVKEILKELGAYYAMPVTGGYGNSGVPDFLVCYCGIFFGIETKAKGGEVTALQRKNLDEIANAGGIDIVVSEHNVDALPTYLKHSVIRKELKNEEINSQ